MASSSARKWFLLERKSFEITLEGRAEDIVRFTEFGRKRKSSICLSKEEAKWFLGEWPRISGESRFSGKCSRFKANDRTLFLILQVNSAGWFIKLLEISHGSFRSLSFPEGAECAGWRRVLTNSAAIIHLIIPKTKQEAVPLAKPDFPPLPRWGKMPEAVAAQKVEQRVVEDTAATENKGIMMMTPNSTFNLSFSCPCCKGIIAGALSLTVSPLLHNNPGCNGSFTAKLGEDGGASGGRVNGIVEGLASGSNTPRGETARGPRRLPRTGNPKSFRTRVNGQQRRHVVGLKKVFRPRLGCLTKEAMLASRAFSKGKSPIRAVQEGGPLVLFNGAEPVAGSSSEPLYVVQSFHPPLKQISNFAFGDELSASGASTPLSPVSLQGDYFSTAASSISSEDDLALAIFDPVSLEPIPLEATPLCAQPPEDLSEKAVSDWVVKRVKGLGKQVGLYFEGFEDQATALFSAIEKKRLEDSQLSAKRATPKTSDVPRELKRLEFGVNYERGSSASSTSLITARGSGKQPVFNG